MTFSFRPPKSDPDAWIHSDGVKPEWLLRGGQMIRVSEDGREAFCEKVRDEEGNPMYQATCPESGGKEKRYDPEQAIRLAVAMVEKSCTLPLEVV